MDETELNAALRRALADLRYITISERVGNERVQSLTGQLAESQKRIAELESDRNLAVLCDARNSLAVQLATAVEALERVLAIARDRQAFVAQGPRAFADAEQIAAAALAKIRGGVV